MAATTEPSPRGGGPVSPGPRVPARRHGRNPASVALGSVVAFLAVLVALAIQLHAGRDPALYVQRPAAVVKSHGATRVVTRASGGTVSVRSGGAGAAAHPAIVTHSSGGGEHDD